ncbi:hypothetical protein BH11VER1_BH11VER1_11830 [soil metagenome]
MNALTSSETESILTLCLMASFADGDKHERERQQMKKITDSLANEQMDVSTLYQKVLLNRPEVSAVAEGLVTPGSRQLAYEMAVCVCDADDVCNSAEQQFLDQLRTALGLSTATTQPADAEAAALTTIPVASPAPALAEETGAMILRYAIVGGALELLPQTMATLAIIPLQSKMVYRIGQQRGHELDRKSIGEFMATVGIGLASQVFEGFARRLTKGLGRTVAGKLGGKIGDAVGGIAMSFASTYAIGHLAQIYYDSGRSLSVESLKSKYQPLLAEGKELAQKYTTQITEQSQQLQGAGLSSLLKGVI